MSTQKKVWVISDTHFNHKEILTTFEFRSADYNEQIIRKINNVIHEDDILIHLGDVIFDMTPTLKSYLDRIKVKTIILVKGNHDKKSNTWYYNQGFTFVCDKIQIDDIVYSHQPIKQIREGLLNIHGHLHTREDAILGYTNNPERYWLYSGEIENFMPALVSNIYKQYKLNK